MGLYKRSSGAYTPAAIAAVKPPNPDPRKFVLGQYEQIGAHLAVWIRYPNCTAYEGRKVLVFADTTIEQLAECPLIDPHFSDTVPQYTRTPVARFEPTLRGWRLARICAVAIS